MLTLRPITAADNAAVAHVIRTVMPEFDCVGEGFSINDPEVDDMYGTYTTPRSAFFVLERPTEADAAPTLTNSDSSTDAGTPSGGIVGCGGYAPLAGGDPKVCELRKMYLLPSARGLGGGRLIMDACLAGARADGFARMYLETVTAMKTARAVYAKYGFELLPGPLGATGHSGCDLFMMRSLGEA